MIEREACWLAYQIPRWDSTRRIFVYDILFMGPTRVHSESQKINYYRDIVLSLFMTILGNWSILRQILAVFYEL